MLHAQLMETMSNTCWRPVHRPGYGGVSNTLTVGASFVTRIGRSGLAWFVTPLARGSGAVRKEHRGLAGRRIVGGNRRKAQGSQRGSANRSPLGGGRDHASGGAPCPRNTPHTLIPTPASRIGPSKKFVIDRYLPTHTLRAYFLGVPGGGVAFSGVIRVLERATNWRDVRQRETKRTEWLRAWIDWIGKGIA